jgi:hypothetical protein
MTVIPPDTKTAKYWQGKLDELDRTQLDTVRATAAKWQGTISTLLGVFGTVAFVTGANTIEKLAPDDADTARFAVTAAAALALGAVLSATYAAQGLPRRHKNPDWPWLEKQSREQAGKALTWLRVSQVLAILAVGLVVVGSVVVLWSSPAKQAAPPANALVRVADGSVRCGAVTTSDGTVGVKFPDGTTVRLGAANQLVTTVATCPS